MIIEKQARFHIGQMVYDPQFTYRGVIIDVDLCFSGTEEWYEKHALNRPPKNEPWYHLLVHNSAYRVYVAESNLEKDMSSEQVNHPEVDYFFSEFKDGIYVSRHSHKQ